MNIKKLFLTNLRFKITLLIVLSLAPLSILGTALIGSRLEQFLVKYSKDNLADEGGEATEALKDWIDKYSSLALTLSKQPEIVGMNEAKQQYLIKQAQSFENVLISTFNSKGAMIATNGVKDITTNFSDRQWFKSALSGQPIAFEKLFNPTNDRLTICFASPIRTELESKIVGVIAVCPNFKKIVEQLREINLGETGFGFLVGKRGYVIVNTEKNHNWRVEKWNDYPPVKAFIENKTGFYYFEDTKTQKQWLSYIEPLAKDYAVIVLKEKQEILELARVYAQLIAVVGFLTTLAVGGTAVVVTSRFTRPIIDLTAASKAMSSGDLGVRVTTDRQDELGVLATSFNTMAEDLQKLIELKIKAAKTQNELEQARKIQENFLPETIPQSEGWEIAAYFKPARQVAGDFYDVFLLPNNQIALVIADVCDKGVGAALFMALTRSLIRAATQQAHLSDPIPLKSAIEFTNNYIAINHGSSNMFATIFFAVLDTATGNLQYSNGGHESGILLKNNGEKVFLKSNSPVVGIMPSISYKIEQVTLEKGDIFLAYTDGVKDARSPSKEFFSEQRLLNLLDNNHFSASELIDLIQTAVHKHIDIAEQFDDITMLSVKRNIEDKTEEVKNGQ
jgi:serine phosphatase RsbU (regulator of sigma subunit)